MKQETALNAMKNDLNSLKDYQFVLREEKPEKKVRFYDSSIWSLCENGNYFYQIDDNCYSCPLHQMPQERSEWFIGKYSQLPKFWQDFKEKEWQSYLKKVAGLRALQERLLLICKEADFEIKDQIDKTIARAKLFYFYDEQSHSTVGRFFQIEGLKGYEKEALTLKNEIQSLYQQKKNLFDQYYNNLGESREVFHVKQAVLFRPETATAKVVTDMILAMFSVVDANIPGILDDIDTEYLHDFRISLRKIRSLLSLIKNIYPEQRDLKKDFSGIASNTNHLRDLDVYLLKKEEYSQMLPEEFRHGLDKLFLQLQNEREKSYKELSGYLSGKDFNKLKARLKQYFLDYYSISFSPQALVPIIDTANKEILKHYKKIHKAGNKLSPDSADDDYHQIRIECKKLRYLLEFFSSLYPDEIINPIIKKLKRLQNSLGLFNDYTVQIQRLYSYTQDNSGEHDFYLALGGLISMLHQEHQNTKKGLYKRICAFCSKEIVDLFNKLKGEKK